MVDFVIHLTLKACPKMSTPVSANPVMVEPKKTPVIYKILVMVSIITLIGGTLTGIMTYVNVGVTEHFYAD